MKILAIEFSSEQRSVALVEGLADGSSRPLGSASENGGRASHAFALTENVLRQAETEREEIDCIAVGLGPGSYTGIRAAIALAQGWQLAREVKLLGISSVECLAAQAYDDRIRGRVNLIVDAQRNEFYLAGYELGEKGFKPIESLHIITRDEVEKRLSAGQIVVGPEATRTFAESKNLFPEATTLGKLACAKGDFVAGEKLEPIYLREVSFVKAPPPRIIGS
jgi:tRNA threonylcarbamoyl adenosine modification protein YeaZ